MPISWSCEVFVSDGFCIKFLDYSIQLFFYGKHQVHSSMPSNLGTSVEQEDCARRLEESNSLKADLK